MPYNLMFRMVLTNREMQVMLRLNRSNNKYQVFKDHAKPVYEKNNVINAPKEYQKLQYILCLMANIVGNSRQGLW